MRFLHKTKNTNRAILFFSSSIFILALAFLMVPANSSNHNASAKSNDKTIFDITTMQEMTKEVCENTTTPTAEAREIVNSFSTDTNLVPTTTLIDIRDDKSYRISKLADGNCWMTQNLDLGDNSTEENPLVLTPQDSNVSANFTLPAMQKGNDYGTGYEWNEGGAGNTTNTKHMYDFTGHSTHDANATIYGNLYNWYTATAGTGLATMGSGEEATDSICPKGWQLPSDTGAKSYYNLLTTTYSLSGTTGSTEMRATPFSFPFSSIYETPSNLPYGQGRIGLFWSSTSRLTLGASDLYFNSSEIRPHEATNKADGCPVRCVNNAGISEPELPDDSEPEEPETEPESEDIQDEQVIPSQETTNNPQTDDQKIIPLVVMAISAIMLIVSLVSLKAFRR